MARANVFRGRPGGNALTVKVVVTGATGNVGTSVLRALGEDDAVDEIVGIARRIPATKTHKTRWVAADVERSELTSSFDGADCVVHLAWRIQPSHDVVALLQPTPPGWLDRGLSVPVMDVTRAREELGWEPRHSSVDAILEVLEGIRDGASTPTPALQPAAVAVSPSSRPATRR